MGSSGSHAMPGEISKFVVSCIVCTVIRGKRKSSCLLYHLSIFNYIMKVILFMAVSLCTCRYTMALRIIIHSLRIDKINSFEDIHFCIFVFLMNA